MIDGFTETVKWSGRLLWRGIAQAFITLALAAAVVAGYFLLSRGHFPPPHVEAAIFMCSTGLVAFWRMNDLWKAIAPRLQKCWQEMQESQMLAPDERRKQSEIQLAKYRWPITGMAVMQLVTFALASVLPLGGDPRLFAIGGLCLGIGAAWAWRLYFRRLRSNVKNDSTTNHEYPWY